MFCRGMFSCGQLVILSILVVIVTSITPPPLFACSSSNHTFTLASRKCDGVVDCPDAEDEDNALCGPPLCAADEVPCDGYHTCVEKRQLCDGAKDCPFATDEQNCSLTCADNMFMCLTPRMLRGKTGPVPTPWCIRQEDRCDLVADCADASDEVGCETCNGKTDRFRCVKPTTWDSEVGPVLIYKCFHKESVCSGDADCDDGSDEGEFCSGQCKLDGRMACKSSLDILTKTNVTVKTYQCIRRDRWCDGTRDCHDGSDESVCGPKPACTADQFRCPNGDCIPNSSVCDGRVDCWSDSSDEDNCDTSKCASVGKFKCSTENQCISELSVCDALIDCMDMSDEANCTNYNCSDSANYFTCTEASTQLARFNECRRANELNSDTCLSAFYTLTSPIYTLCIPMAQRCNGRGTCAGGTDEIGCTTLHCPEGETKCPDNSACLFDSQICDQNKNCDDGWDERDCKVPPPTCENLEVLCNNGAQCIRVGFICDGDKDCMDGSDEQDCGGSRIQYSFDVDTIEGEMTTYQPRYIGK